MDRYNSICGHQRELVTPESPEFWRWLDAEWEKIWQNVNLITYIVIYHKRVRCADIMHWNPLKSIWLFTYEYCFYFLQNQIKYRNNIIDLSIIQVTYRCEHKNRQTVVGHWSTWTWRISIHQDIKNYIKKIQFCVTNSCCWVLFYFCFWFVVIVVVFIVLLCFLGFLLFCWVFFFLFSSF